MMKDPVKATAGWTDLEDSDASHEYFWADGVTLKIDHPVKYREFHGGVIGYMTVSGEVIGVRENWLWMKKTPVKSPT